MNIRRIVLSSAAFMAVSGCEKLSEYLPTFKEKLAIEQAVDESSNHDADVVPEPRANGELQAFRVHVESVSKMLTLELSEASRRVDEIRSDSEVLAKAMSAATSCGKESGATVSRKDALLSLLRNDAVNALARRYLRRSLSMDALAVEDRVGDAETRVARRRREIEDNAASAKSDMESAENENRRARASVLEAEQRMQREIEELVQREKRIKHELNMLSAFERKIKERELSDISADLRRLRREHSAMHASGAVNRELHRSDESLRRVRLEADTRRSRADAEVRKGDVGISPDEVIAEFEHSTVLALEKSIVDALDAAEARKTLVARAVEYVKSAGNVRETLAAVALRRIRADIDEHVDAVMKGK